MVAGVRKLKRGFVLVLFALIYWGLSEIQRQRSSNKSNRLVRKIIRPIREDPLTIVIAHTNFKDDLLDFEWWSNMSTCPEKCKLVSPKNASQEMPYAEAIVFNPIIGDMSMTWLRQMLALRNPKQLWVFYTHESPESLKNNMPSELNGNYSVLNGIFNWTQMCRTDADVFIPHLNQTNFVELSPFERPKKTLWKSTKGKKHIAAMIANCKSWNYDRIPLFSELRRYDIVADIEGKCNPASKCRKGTDLCIQNIERNYLFYASFENSLCEEYVTEKFFRAFTYDLVPVVIGGGHYERLAPEGSYINARHFKFEGDLAWYLKYLAENETAYNSYFNWRRKYKLEEPKHSIFCKLCIKLHERRRRKDFKSKVYEDFDYWFRKKKPCGGPLFLGEKPVFNENIELIRH